MEKNESNVQDGTKAKTKNTKRKIGAAGFGALTLVMLVIVLVALGSQIRSIWPLNLQLDMPFEISSANNETVVIDNGGTRISLINEKLEATLIADLDPKSQHGERYETAFLCDRGCYYSTSKVFDNSAFISSEQVYYRESSYAKPQLVYQRTYEESQHVFNSVFFSITAAENGSDVTLTCQNADYSKIEIVSLVDSPGEIIGSISAPEEVGSLFYMSYSDSAHAYALVSNVGGLFISKDNGELLQVNLPGYNCIRDCVWDAQGLLYAVDGMTGALICVDPADGSQIVRTDGAEYTCNAVDASGRYVTCGTSNGFETYDSADFYAGISSAPRPVYVLDEPVPYSAVLRILTIAVWVAIVYLAACVVVLIVRLVRTMLRQEKIHALSIAAVVIVAIAGIVGVTLLYSNQYYTLAVQSLENNASAMCEDIAETMLPALANQETLSGNGTSEGDEIGAALSTKSKSYATYNISAEIACMAKNRHGMTSVTADAGGYNVQYSLSTSTMDDESFQVDALAAKDYAATSMEQRADGDYIVSFRSIVSDEGDIVGATLVNCEITDLTLSHRNLRISLAMTLLAAGGAIALVVIEGKAALEARARRREEKKIDGGRSEIWSVRQMNFWAAMASGLDSTIAILVAKEMLEAQGIVGVDALVGVPIMLSTLGMFAGTVLFGILSSRVSSRKICVVGGVCAGIFFALSAVAVFANNFWLFCLFRTVASISITTLGSLVGALPLRARDEQTQTKLFEDYAMSGVSGVALGTMASGYVSEIFGNGAIYLACIVPIALALLLSLKGLPRALRFDETEQNGQTDAASSTAKGTQKKALLRLFLSPAVIALIVFAMFPITIINGYKSVFFPLFMSDAGISKVYINNIVVFSNVVILLLSPQIARAVKGIDRWFVVLACLLCSAATCVWFMVNSTTAWAILALVLLGLAYRVSTPSMKTLLPRAARHYGASETSANNMLSMLDEFESAIRSPFLSTLAGFGQMIACLFVGIICAFGAVLFALLSAKSPLRAQESEATSEVDADIEGDVSAGRRNRTTSSS